MAQQAEKGTFAVKVSSIVDFSLRKRGRKRQRARRERKLALALFFPPTSRQIE